MSNRKPSFAIVGGGIAGLTCALAIARAGMVSVVLEQYSVSEDVGAGIQLSPNATRCLYALGLRAELFEIAQQPERMRWRDGVNDRLLAEFTLGNTIAKRFNAPFLQFYRPELIDLLANACDANPLIELRRNELVNSLEVAEQGCLLRSSQGSVIADVCVGADGTHSFLRQFHHQGDDSIESAGWAFRAMLDVDFTKSLEDDRSTDLWLNESFHVVAYPVGSPRRLNCVFVIESDSFDKKPDLHRQKATKEDLQRSIPHTSPMLSALLEQVPEEGLYEWPLYQFAPIERNEANRNPVVLIGDAWHTTLPFAGQGAALAIEDAIVLAESFSHIESESYLPYLSRFEQIRMPRIRAVQTISSRNRRIYHLRNTALKRIRNTVANVGFRSTSRKIFSYDASSLA